MIDSYKISTLFSYSFWFVGGGVVDKIKIRIPIFDELCLDLLEFYFCVDEDPNDKRSLAPAFNRYIKSPPAMPTFRDSMSPGMGRDTGMHAFAARRIGGHNTTRTLV